MASWCFEHSESPYTKLARRHNRHCGQRTSSPKVKIKFPVVAVILPQLFSHRIGTYLFICPGADSELQHSSVKPKFHYADFHRNFPTGKVVDTNHESRRHKRWQIMKPWRFGESRRHRSWKSRTQTISTCRNVCDKVHDKPVCIVLMEFSLLQCTGKVGNKVWDISRQSCGLVADTNRESRRCDLCRGLSWFVSASLSWTFPGLCRKVGVMEFGLYMLHLSYALPLFYWHLGWYQITLLGDRGACVCE